MKKFKSKLASKRKKKRFSLYVPFEEFTRARKPKKPPKEIIKLDQPRHLTSNIDFDSIK